MRAFAGLLLGGDGRATSIEEAILAHGGDAAAARAAFRDLPEADEAALLDFLSGL